MPSSERTDQVAKSAKAAGAIKFRFPVKHGTLQFIPNVALAFEDKDAAPYFIAAGFADETDDDPVMTYPQDSVSIDPETVFAGTRQKVMEGRANG